MKKISYRGQFWLPDTPDRKISGVLEFEPGSGGTVSLIGELADTFGGGGFDENNVPRIVGQRTNGPYVTLDHCFQTNWMIGLGGAGEQTYHVGMIFDGVAYDRDEPTEFDRVDVDLRHLLGWTGRSSLTETIPFTHRAADAPTAAWSLSAEPLPNLTATVEHGVELGIAHSIGVSGASSQRSIVQAASLQVRLDASRSVEELVAYVTSVQNLVSIATDRVAEYDSFTLFSPTITRPHPSRKASHLHPVDLYVEWVAQERSDKQFHAAQAIAPFAAIGGIEGVAIWIRNTKIFAAELSRVMATRYAGSMYADDRFFNRIAALEGLHRQITGRRSGVDFVVRMRELASLAGEPFKRLVANIETWVQNVKIERNDHAHHLGNAANTTGATRYYLADSAYWLFVMCLFRQCAYSAAVFDSIEKSATVSWVRDRLSTVLT